MRLRVVVVVRRLETALVHPLRHLIAVEVVTAQPAQQNLDRTIGIGSAAQEPLPVALAIVDMKVVRGVPDEVRPIAILVARSMGGLVIVEIDKVVEWEYSQQDRIVGKLAGELAVYQVRLIRTEVGHAEV